MAEPVILSARGLDFYYGGTRVLRKIDLDIPARQVTTLIGPSGCGKSTFLRCLNRMNDLIPGARAEGSLSFHGAEFYARGVDVTELRRRIGMVFQKPNLFPMSVYDNVAYGPRLHGVRVSKYTIISMRDVLTRRNRLISQFCKKASQT